MSHFDRNGGKTDAHITLTEHLWPIALSLDSYAVSLLYSLSGVDVHRDRRVLRKLMP